MPGHRNIHFEKPPSDYVACLTLNCPDRRYPNDNVTVDKLGTALEEIDLETALKMASAETFTLTSRDHAEGALDTRQSRKPEYEGR